MFKKLSWLSDIKENLKEIKSSWNYGQNDFYFDRSSKCLVPKEQAQFTFLKNIFGQKFQLNAPSDARIYLREDKVGVIIVSLKQNLVLKIFLEKFNVGNLNREIAVLKKIKGSDFEPFAPRHISSGELQNGGVWLLTDAFSATEELNETKLFHEIMDVMRPMSKFYHLFGIQEKSFEEWKEESILLLKKHKKFQDLQKIIKIVEEEMERIKELPILYSTLHADLHKMNILSNKKEKLIIDWEGTCYDPIFQDYFDFLRRFLQKNAAESKPFWDFVTGKIQNVPPNFQPFFENFFIWMRKEFNTEIHPQSARVLFCIYCLQRTASLIKARGDNAIQGLVFESEKLVSIL